MGRIVIVKVGSTLQSLASKKGDFEDWILSGMHVDEGSVMVVDVLGGSSLPNCGEIAGIVITGSHSMVTEHAAWSERTAKWLSGAVERRVPVLGICYGHQLLAYALGGEVGDNPRGREFGTVEVHLNEEARRDPILGGFPSPMRVHMAHTQSVLRLPPVARRLAWSAMDENQAFVVGDCAWGVQFHPEFDAAILKKYIHHYREPLIEEGKDPQDLISRCADTPLGGDLLVRFAEIAWERAKPPAPQR